MERIKILTKNRNYGVISQEEMVACLAKECNEKTLMQAYEEGLLDFEECVIIMGENATIN